jgi:hypothetical protein
MYAGKVLYPYLRWLCGCGCGMVNERYSTPSIASYCQISWGLIILSQMNTRAHFMSSWIKRHTPKLQREICNWSEEFPAIELLCRPGKSSTGVVVAILVSTHSAWIWLTSSYKSLFAFHIFLPMQGYRDTFQCKYGMQHATRQFLIGIISNRR